MQTSGKNASVLFYIVKCYEKIRHIVLQTRAKKHNSNLKILRVCIVVYAGPRVLQVNGACSRPEGNKGGHFHCGGLRVRHHFA